MNNSTENAVVVEDDRVIIYDELATDVILDLVAYGSAGSEAGEKFNEQFEILGGSRYFMADPAEDFYQGISVMCVIQRKSDGRLFGFPYWTPIAKHSEPSIEANGDQNGLEFDPPDGFDWDNDYFPSPYVFLPIEPFTITGYKIAGA